MSATWLCVVCGWRYPTALEAVRMEMATHEAYDLCPMCVSTLLRKHGIAVPEELKVKLTDGMIEVMQARLNGSATMEVACPPGSRFTPSLN